MSKESPEWIGSCSGVNRGSYKERRYLLNSSRTKEPLTPMSTVRHSEFYRRSIKNKRLMLLTEGVVLLHDKALLHVSRFLPEELVHFKSGSSLTIRPTAWACLHAISMVFGFL
ncbi:hypothetical protein TNIN_81791 [Trichonephila inaurata madagascariensis]|uniref:Uncharacterized protein n=1 Tax=Trichonephila inaurata madagascariensis TaxID=2747483 RepID=A0A8X7C7N1_9ARAC|nr:hypothetical protein TNIN_81791 [Trichonephila inaurata madagascariensis]